MKTLHCVIYRSAKQASHYLYVEREDEFTRVPQALLTLLGKLEYVMSLELDAQRKLAQADVVQVMQRLEDQGYYLQMPPVIERNASLQ